MADQSPAERLTEEQRRILIAVVEGYRAREGMKERLRALNEWEIARRAGSTTLSHAEYMCDQMRDQVRAVLAELERLGLVSTWERGVSYESFVPTEAGGFAVDAANGEATAATPREAPASPQRRWIPFSSGSTRCSGFCAPSILA